MPSEIGWPSRSRISTRSSEVPKTRSGVGGSPGLGQEARADGHVALVGAHHASIRAQLGRGVLAVGVEAAAVVVAAVGGAAVALGDALAQPAVLGEAHDLRAALAGDLGGRVGGAVVDHEHVDVGQSR